jgi:hypothetical protein
MVTSVVILGMVLPVLLAVAFLLGRHVQRLRRPEAPEFSAVTRQHFELYQTGQVNEAAVEAAKRRFQYLLERGEEATVEASLRPGMQYFFQVRALAEIGTDSAGRILERQLQRRLSDDQLEQAWYWIDLASGLRVLNRVESLPQLLRCADFAAEVPLGHFFAVETICFLGFPGYLRDLDTPQGQAALRMLHRALEGLRFGVPPHLIGEAHLGEMIENLWDEAGEKVEPLLVRIAHEVLRLNQRSDHGRRQLEEERAELEVYDWQMSRLQALTPTLQQYLQEARRVLPARVLQTPEKQLPDVLHALIDLQVDAGPALITLVNRPGFTKADLALEALGHSRHPSVGPWLRAFAFKNVPMLQRAHARKRAASPGKPSVPAQVPYRAVLRALRGHGSEETERLLIVAARDWDPMYRAVALSSLGWWEPLARREVLASLEEGRRDASLEVRQAARAALARLGERQALQWFRQGLTGEDGQQVHEAIQVIAAEGLFMLWPDLDRLADSDNPEVAMHAREALERLCEDIGKK